MATVDKPIFDIGFPPAKPQPAEPALGMAKQTIEQFERSIDTAIRRCLAGGTIAVGQCQACVKQSIETVVNTALDTYTAAGYNIESAIAFELARVSADLSQLGCDMTGLPGGSPVSVGTAGTPPGQPPTAASPSGGPGGSFGAPVPHNGIGQVPGEPGAFFRGACCNARTGQCIDGLTSIECDDHGEEWRWLGPDTHCGGPEAQLLCKLGVPGPTPTPTPTPGPRPTPTPTPRPTPTPPPSCPSPPTCPPGTTLASIQCCPNGHSSTPGGDGTCPQCCVTCTPTGAPPPVPKYCCLNPGSDNPTCVQVTDSNMSMCPAGAALYDSMAECAAACSRPPRPRPPPGGITTDGCPPPIVECPPPEVIVNVPPCPKPEPPPPKIWRAWKRCSDDSCYITGPDESVDNAADRLIAQSKDFDAVYSAAQAHCCCEPQDKPSSQHNLLFGARFTEFVSLPGGNGNGSQLPFGAPFETGGSVCASPGVLHAEQTGTVDWNDAGVCNELDKQDAATIQAPSHNLAQWLGLEDKDGNSTYPKSWTDRYGQPDWLGRIIWRGIVGITQILDSGRAATAAVTGCSKPLALDALFNEQGMGLLEHVFGAGLEDFRLRYRYTKRYFCPQEIPSAAEADEAYLRDAIDENLWRCWIRANGKLEDPWRKILNAKSEKLTLGETVNLWRRSKIDDEEFAKRVRQFGFLTEQNVKDIKELSHEIPPISDIVRFMTREVYDEATVERFQLDKLFDERYNRTRLKEWGESQGITEEAARAYWRAHWIYASPGQLKEMYQRLRNNPDPVLQFGRQDVETLLRHQDFLPSLIPRLIEISFRPLALSDLRRGYYIGSLDRQELLDGLAQIGYSDPNAERLGREFDRVRINSARTNVWVKAYQNTTINRAVTERHLRDIGFVEGDIETVLDEANERRDAAVVGKCERAYVRRFDLGDFDDEDLRKALFGLGLDSGQVEAKVREAHCTKVARGKTVPAAALCRWYERGIITGVEYRRRLINLGYTETDAIDLILDCQKSIDIKREKAAAAKLKEEKREREKAAAAAARLAKELAREKARLEKEKERKEKAAEKRAELILKAASVAAKQLGVDTIAAGEIIAGVIKKLQDERHLTTDDATEDVVRAAETSVYSNAAELLAAAEAIVSVEATELALEG